MCRYVVTNWWLGDGYIDIMVNDQALKQNEPKFKIMNIFESTFPDHYHHIQSVRVFDALK